MQIANLAREDYAKFSLLCYSNLDAYIVKAEILRRLYKRFLTSDKSKFKSITEKTAGKGSLGKPKEKMKVAKPRSKKKSIFDRIFGN